jgi:polycomb protein SUZ12
MKGRSTRRSNNKLRASFKIDSMKDRVENEEKNKELAKKLNNEEHLIIGFVSFYDNSLNVINVDVDTSLEKLPSKRKKDNNQGQSKIHIGSSLVVVNTEDNHTDKIPAVCISKSDFNNLGENGQMSYSLNFDIRSTNTQMSRKESINGQPPSKFQCLSKIYNAEICVFDKNGKNLIENGIYEIIANEGNNENRVNGVQSWIEQVNEICFTSDDEDTDHLAAFEKTPKIHLYLEWTKKSLTGKYINKPKILSDQHNNNNKENLPLPLPSEKQQNGQLNGIVKRENKPFLIQFVVNATTKQRTEESFEYECPWCVLKCPHLYGFVKHLKLSHSRFLFQFIDEGSKHRIDVFLNDMYDGSYSGAPHNVLMGSSSSCPQRRSVVTNIIVFRPRKPTFNMAEFQENDDACFDQQHQYISGHNRIYYHSETCVPIMPKELEYDSEGESHAISHD